MPIRKSSGFYGWRLLLALGTLYFILVGFTFYSAPIMFPYMVRDMGWSRSEISLGFTVFVLTMGLFSTLCAWTIRKFGARRTIVAGSLVCSIGSFLMQFCNSPAALILFFGLLMGAGMSMSTAIPIQTTVGFWFNRYRGTAMGLVLAGSAAGGFVAPALLTGVIHLAGDNWRAGWLAGSLVILAGSAIAYFFVHNRPADLDQYPDGTNLRTSDMAPASGATDNPRVFRSTLDWGLWDAVKTRQLWFLTIAYIGCNFTWQVMVSQGPLHLADRGFSPGDISLIYGLTIGLSIIGRLGAGFLIDRIDPRIVFLGALLTFMAGALLFWLAAPDYRVSLAYPLFSGVGLGAVAIIMPNLVGNYWGVGAFPSVNGVIYPLMTVCASVAAPLAGIVYDMQGSYLPIIIACEMLLAISVPLVFFARPPRTEKAPR